MTASDAKLGSLRLALRHVPLFATVTDADLQELCVAARRRFAEPGERVVTEGEEGDSLLVILAGELEITKREGGREVTLARRGAGEFLGEMSLLQQAPRSASARALQRTEIIEIGPLVLRRLLERHPDTASTILRAMAARLRSTEASLIQNEKLASLGTLAAGLAHELNNPAAAIARSSRTLPDAIAAYQQASVAVHILPLTADEQRRFAELQASTPVAQDPATAPDEAHIETWLEGLGIAEPWELAASLADGGWSAERLRALADGFASDHRPAVLSALGMRLVVAQLIHEIRLGADAVSHIVNAVRSYAYLDRAPVQSVDLRASLEDTLTILQFKLKHSVTVERHFDAQLPAIEAYAGELNQVWTNLIDNAVQAMDGRGILALHVRPVGDNVEVRIVDSGPGIPADVLPRLFEPFFTTKPQGQGTGLGLHIAYNIVVHRHRGRIEAQSQPGRTEFRIVLPIRLASADGPIITEST